MSIYLFFLLQAATGQTAEIAAPLAPSTPILWRELREGITPEQFADSLRKIDGIRAVDVTRKPSKPAKIRISYVNGTGLPVGALDVEITPTFEKNALSSIELAQAGCFSTMKEALTQAAVGVREKYPNHQNVSMVDENGVKIDTQYAFFNDQTRLTISSTNIANPYPKHLYGGSGFVAAANSIANAAADSTYNSNIQACPNDSGMKARISLTYVSQVAFAAQHSKEEAARKAKAEATKNGL